MKMNKGQIIGIVGAVIVIIGMFLPWATVSAEEVGSETVYGYISPFLWISLILVLIGVFVPKTWGGLLAAIFGILGFLDAIWNQQQIYALKNLYSDVNIDIGYGGYIIIIGFIIAFIGGILHYIYIKKERKEESTQSAQAPPEDAETVEE